MIFRFLLLLIFLVNKNILVAQLPLVKDLYGKYFLIKAYFPKKGFTDINEKDIPKQIGKTYIIFDSTKILRKKYRGVLDSCYYDTVKITEIKSSSFFSKYLIAKKFYKASKIIKYDVGFKSSFYFEQFPDKFTLKNNFYIINNYLLIIDDDDVLKIFKRALLPLD